MTNGTKAIFHNDIDVNEVQVGVHVGNSDCLIPIRMSVVKVHVRFTGKVGIPLLDINGIGIVHHGNGLAGKVGDSVD